MNASTRGSRREIALVAGALLLPIPVLAGSGLTFPLPDAVERGIASLSQSAGGGGPLAAGDSISVGAPDKVAPATRAFVFDEPVARFGDTGTAIPDPSAAEPAEQSASVGAGGSVGAAGGSSGVADAPGGEKTPTTGASPTADDAPTTGGSPPDDELPSVEHEAESAPASAAPGKPSLLRLVGSGQGISIEAAADDDGSAVISTPAADSGPPGVEIAVSPDEQPGVAIGASPTDAGLKLP
ncbi:MAG: hypothetical protein M3546_01265 [Actinomycetota bacterium]|nr:hypothetical protein [Actinomycetota bacterium]